jgi:hypothetical protein
MSKYALIGLVMISSPVSARSLQVSGIALGADAVKTASEVGELLAAEEHCSLSYDQEAITAYIGIDSHADPASLPSSHSAFIYFLEGMVRQHDLTLADMSSDESAEHCQSIEQSAKRLGFIQP